MADLTGTPGRGLDPVGDIPRWPSSAASGTLNHFTALILAFRGDAREAEAGAGRTPIVEDFIARRRAELRFDINHADDIINDRDRTRLLDALDRADSHELPLFAPPQPSVWQRLRAAVTTVFTRAATAQPVAPGPDHLPTVAPVPASRPSPAPPRQAVPSATRAEIMRQLDILPEAAFTEVRQIGRSRTAEKIIEALDRGVLDNEMADRARIVVGAVVEDAQANIKFTREPVALVVHPHQFDMWHEARPYLPGTPELDTPTTPMDLSAVFESGAEIAALARPSTLSRGQDPSAGTDITPAAHELAAGVDAAPAAGI
ncbi:hypothetical protein [Nocardia suismassiliense]|uniref:hypothetical protein n=1 Tax=Nocardia suismassiliense TaxID=2077092 RepID=UPI000D1DFF1D|nr:hypothetical protein [Nocardia suismassiliense]